MINQNQIIVTAHTNSKESMFSPDCIRSVLEVIADPVLKEGEYLLLQKYFFPLRQMRRSSIHASSCHSLKSASGKDLITTQSNSYAAPTITAHVYNLLFKFSQFSLSGLQIYAMIYQIQLRSIIMKKLNLISCNDYAIVLSDGSTIWVKTELLGGKDFNP